MTKNKLNKCWFTFSLKFNTNKRCHVTMNIFGIKNLFSTCELKKGVLFIIFEYYYFFFQI